MFNTWTLKIRNFGKISEADIRITPFMMFVGENNSGKSYILELLWGVFRNLNFLLRNDTSKDEELNQLLSELSVSVKNSSFNEITQIKTIAIGEEFQSRLLSVFNKTLMNNKDWLTKRIFNHSVSIGHLEILREEYFNINIEVEKRKMSMPELLKESESGEMELIEVTKEMNMYQLKLINGAGEDERIATFALEQERDKLPLAVLYRIIETLVCRDYSMVYGEHYASRRLLANRNLRREYEPVYFPASRTGFMHTYQTLLGNDRKKLREQLAVEDMFGDIDKKDLLEEKLSSTLRLTAPVQDFLDKLSEIYLDDDQQQLYVEEIEFLNSNIFHGVVTFDQARNYRFVTDEVDEGLPLHVTSSLVAELAPLSIFLASQYDPQLFIIEESESHLHVKKQLELVRLFFRLINKGKSIWLTTHSDSFAQQVNNLLTLSQHPRKEDLFQELGYEESDTLKDVSYSSCYQFKSVNGKTIVEEIELGTYGFVIPTFNSVLEKLLIETSKIQDFGEVNE